VPKFASVKFISHLQCAMLIVAVPVFAQELSADAELCTTPPQAA
jgi:predicted phosphoribosyltransferase